MQDTCRLLVVEDDISRINLFQSWCPITVRLVWAKSAGVALGILQRDRGKVYSGILLDHDLLEQTITSSDEYLNGFQVVQAIINNTSPDVPILIHSMNHLQAPLMQSQLEDAGFCVTRIPMSVLDQKKFLQWLDECECDPPNIDDVVGKI